MTPTWNKTLHDVQFFKCINCGALSCWTKISIRCIQPLSHFSGRCIREMLFTQVSPVAQPVLYCTVPRPRPRNCTEFIGLGLKYLSGVSVRPVLYHLLSGFIGLGLKYLSAGQGVDLLYITRVRCSPLVIYNRSTPYPADKYFRLRPIKPLSK